MQYRYLTQAFRGSDAFDGLTQLGRLRVPSRGEDNANQFVGSEPTRLTSQATLSGINQKRQQGLIDQRKDYLCFGVAKSDVELDDFWAFRCQHQSNVEKAPERLALRFHAVDDRIDDLADNPRFQVGVEQNAERTGTNTAR